MVNHKEILSKEDFEQYTVLEVESPTIDSKFKDIETKFQEDLAIIKKGYKDVIAQYPGEDTKFKMDFQLKRFQAIVSNNQFIRKTRRDKQWGDEPFACFGTVEIILVKEDYSDDMVRWVKFDSSHNWMPHKAVNLHRDIAFPQITNEEEYHITYDKLKESKGSYPIFHTEDGLVYCIRPAGSKSAKFQLPIVTKDLVEILTISNCNGTILKVTKTRKDAVSFMIAESEENEYQENKLKTQLASKIHGARKKGVDFKKPFPPNGNTQFILEFGESVNSVVDGIKTTNNAIVTSNAIAIAENSKKKPRSANEAAGRAALARFEKYNASVSLKTSSVIELDDVEDRKMPARKTASDIIDLLDDDDDDESAKLELEKLAKSRDVIELLDDDDESNNGV